MIWCFVVLFWIGDIWCYAKASEMLMITNKRLRLILGSGFYLYLKGKGVL